MKLEGGEKQLLSPLSNIILENEKLLLSGSEFFRSFAYLLLFAVNERETSISSPMVVAAKDRGL
jgi:hypothetical protein